MTKPLVVLPLVILSGTHLRALPYQQAAIPVCAPAATSKPATPNIEKVERSPREDGVWHQITVRFAGEVSQKYNLELKWDAQTLREDGQGTTNTKSQSVETDAKGNGLWAVEVKGYPAGKMRARLTDKAGSSSDWSSEFDVPWLY